MKFFLVAAVSAIMVTLVLVGSTLLGYWLWGLSDFWLVRACATAIALIGVAGAAWAMWPVK